MSNKKKTPKDRAQGMMARFSKMEENYRERLRRQADTIDRLVKAHTVAAAALSEVSTEVTNVKDARKVTTQAEALIKEILAVPEEENNS